MLTKQLEVDFLKAVSEQLASGEINTPIAKRAGKDFLDLLPFNSESDMQEKIKTFAQKYQTMEKVYAILLTYLDEEKTVELLDKLRLYIHKTA